MEIRLARAWPALIAALLLTSGGCAAEPDADHAARPGPGESTAPTRAEAPPPAAPGEAAGASPELNARFLSDQLDVEEMTQIFEGESREVSIEREAIVDRVGLSPGDHVADIGAGTGLFEPLFSRAVGRQGRVHAVDISPRFLAHLRERVEREGLGNVEVVEGTGDSAGLAPSSVDVVFVCDTYHHFEDPAAMLADLHATLRPGGQLVVIDFERIPGVTPDWIVDHVRAGKAVFRSEIEAAGFELLEEVEMEGLEQNYMLRFVRR